MSAERIGGVEVDSLEVGFWVDLNKEWCDAIDTLQQQLNDRYRAKRQLPGLGADLANAKPMNPIVGERIFRVRPGGGMPYALTLVCEEFDLRVATGYRNASEAHAPSCFVAFRSKFLHEYGWVKAVDIVRDWLNKHAGTIMRTTVSRVDLCCDVRTDEIDVGWLEGDAVVTRARTKATGGGEDFEGESAAPVAGLDSFAEYYANFDGEYFNGYRIGSRGRSSVFFRLYDKFRQSARVADAGHVREHWARCGWNGARAPADAKGRFASIWRAEFEIRAEVLQSFGVHQIDDLRSVVVDGSMWSYCTREWLRFVQPLDNWRTADRDERGRYLRVTRREDRPVQAWWAVVQGAEVPPAERVYRRLPRVSEQQVKQGVGCLASYIASEAENEYEALQTVMHVWRELPQAVVEKQYARAAALQCEAGQFETSTLAKALAAASDAFCKVVRDAIASDAAHFTQSGVGVSLLRRTADEEHRDYARMLAHQAARHLWGPDLFGGLQETQSTRKAVPNGGLVKNGDGDAVTSYLTRCRAEEERGGPSRETLATAAASAEAAQTYRRFRREGRSHDEAFEALEAAQAAFDAEHEREWREQWAYERDQLQLRE